MAKKHYYLFNPGRMSRKDNTLKFVIQDENGISQKPKYLPIEGVKSLYIFGSVDANSATYNFLGRQRIPVHFFDYYEHYTGSFYPKEYLLAGKMQIAQTQTFLNAKRRMHIARALIEGATANMMKNLKYYHNRGQVFDVEMTQLHTYAQGIDSAIDIPSLMGVEGNCRMVYYQCFNDIIQDFEMNNRTKRPPSNEVNALISFVNMMCYALCLDQIYHTQLNPTISFLHDPGTRRYSLALDIAEVFKPILVDRLIFKVLNKKMIKTKHFEQSLNGCFLKDAGKIIVIQEWESRLSETIKHRSLNRKVSYKQLVKLECYKIAKYILEMDKQYQPFKIWW